MGPVLILGQLSIEETGKIMEIAKFINIRPYLYHLTFAENVSKILEHKKLFSANKIMGMSSNNNFIREKRTSHIPIIIGDKTYWLRDQQPISEKALAKCLTNNWTCNDFFEHLNNRVFTWPTLDRLKRHFNRYCYEKPLILRFDTALSLELNSHVEFCRLNSGATRANSFLGGIPPFRGIDTFVSSENYFYSPGSVAEVVFEDEFILPNEFSIGSNPEGKWKNVEL